MVRQTDIVTASLALVQTVAVSWLLAAGPGCAWQLSGLAEILLETGCACA